MSLIRLLFSPNGRVTRLTYWVFMLSYTAIYFFLMLLNQALGESSVALTIQCVLLLVLFVGIVPSWMISIKRCHDLGRSGWFTLLTFVPLVNFWYLFEVGFLAGTAGSNPYGPDPLRSRDPGSELAAEESEAAYAFGPYTDTGSDAYGADTYNHTADEDPDDFFTSAEDQAAANEIFGMSPVEIVILAILLVVICSFGSFVGLKFLFNRAVEPVAEVVYPPTATTIPTAIPSPTVTPVVKSTPIPGWSQFTFADGKAEIWLPSTYQGGDTVAYPEIVAMTIDTFLTDEGFIEPAKAMIADPGVSFFAFDTQPADFTQFVVVGRETNPAGLNLTMDAYLEATLAEIEQGTRTIEDTDRYITSLDYYDDVGVLLVEYSVPVEEGVSMRVKESWHMIKVDNEIWVIFFVTSGANFDAYFPTIENSVRSFYWEP